MPAVRTRIKIKKESEKEKYANRPCRKALYLVHIGTSCRCTKTFPVVTELTHRGVQREQRRFRNL